MYPKNIISFRSKPTSIGSSQVPVNLTLVEALMKVEIDRPRSGANVNNVGEQTKPGTSLSLASLVVRAAARTERRRPYLTAGRGAASTADSDVHIHP